MTTGRPLQGPFADPIRKHLETARRQISQGQLKGFAVLAAVFALVQHVARCVPDLVAEVAIAFDATHA